MERERGPSSRKRRRGESSGGGGEQTVSVGAIELGALDCTVCYHPLTHRIFQCATGHVICSYCHGKLLNKDKCHVCSITGGYHRCIALEKVLEAVRVPCSNVVRGCAVATRYNERAWHERSCPHRQLAGSVSVSKLLKQAMVILDQNLERPCPHRQFMASLSPLLDQAIAILTRQQH